MASLIHPWDPNWDPKGDPRARFGAQLVLQMGPGPQLGPHTGPQKALMNLHLGPGWFPGAFLKLLGPPEYQKQALAYLKVVFEKLQVDEEKATGDAMLSKVLHNMQFPQHSLVREWIVLLAEWQFKFVPQSLHDAIDQMACGLDTSKVVEDMF